MSRVYDKNGLTLPKPDTWNVKSYAEMAPINCASCGRVIEWSELKSMHYSSELFSYGNFPLLLCGECAFEEANRDEAR